MYVRIGEIDNKSGWRYISSRRNVTFMRAGKSKETPKRQSQVERKRIMK